jgi:hypothetical protein
MRLSVSPATPFSDGSLPNHTKMFELVHMVTSSNGKTSLVHYRTLSFFAFRFKKKRKFAFFRGFKYKITIEPVRFASIL